MLKDSATELTHISSRVVEVVNIEQIPPPILFAGMGYHLNWLFEDWTGWEHWQKEVEEDESDHSGSVAQPPKDDKCEVIEALDSRRQ